MVDNINMGKLKILKKSENLSKSKKSDFIKVSFFKTDFLISKAKKTFNHLQKSFTKAAILQHSDLEYHIQIKTDTFSYSICGCFS